MTIFHKTEWPSWVFRWSTRDFAWAAARNTMLRAVPVPHSLQKPRHSLWSQLCRPVVTRQCRSSSWVFPTLKHLPSQFCSIAVMSFLWRHAQPFWGIYLLQNRTWTCVSLIKSCGMHTLRVAQQMPSAFDSADPKIAHAAAVWANCFSFCCL